MNRTELALQLTAVAASLATLNSTAVKIESETQGLLDKVSALEDALENAEFSTPEIDEALAAVHEQKAALAAVLQSVDDKVADAEPPAEPPIEP